MPRFVSADSKIKSLQMCAHFNHRVCASSLALSYVPWLPERINVRDIFSSDNIFTNMHHTTLVFAISISRRRRTESQLMQQAPEASGWHC